MKFLLICAFTVLIGSASCTKNNIQPNKVKPVMELVYPKDLPLLKAGQPLCIKIIITDDEQIRSVDWSIRQPETGKVFFRNTVSGTGNRNYVFDEKFIVTENLAGDQLVVVKTLDQCGNSAEINIPFLVKN